MNRDAKRDAKREILAIDAGTTALKLAVYTEDLEKQWETARRYDVNVYGDGMADIEPEKWWAALGDCCREGGARLGDVGVVSLSVTTPGLTPMAADGAALGPAILFFDGRSRAEARAIRQAVPEETFLRETCNLPVTGGSSLCSILWIRENQPEVWDRAARFGHTNTYLVKRLTGNWAIDPSTVSITCLYNTARNDLTWNRGILEAAGIPESKLPTLMHSYEPAGTVLPGAAAELGLPAGAVVLCGGNDAVLGAFSGGMTRPGEINNICGTCEITSTCTDRPVASPDFNVRCHVLPGLWLTFFVLNTGGKALEWFHATFCNGMPEAHFYGEYIPAVLEAFLRAPDVERREALLPVYSPFLGGSRYSLDRLTARFEGVTLETTREDMLLAVIRGNAQYHGGHLREVGKMVALGRRVVTTGGGAGIRGYIDAKRRWTGDFDYQFREECSVLGAAMLGRIHQRGKV